MVMDLNQLKDMTMSEMIDMLGHENAKQKELSQSTGLLKEAIKSRALLDGDFAGKEWGVRINIRVRHSLNTRIVREEMGTDWYDERCVDTEYREVRSFILEDNA